MNFFDRALRTATAAALSLLIAVVPALPQAALLPNAKQTFLDQNGNPLSNGSVFMYVPNTAVKKQTWLDAAETQFNTNPILLDAAGRAVIYGQGGYSQQVLDADGNQQWNALTNAYGSSSPSGATGTDTAPVGTLLPFTAFVLPTNWQYAYGQALNRLAFPELLAAVTIVDSTAACTSGSTTITGLFDTHQMAVGSSIEATCLPVNTVITYVLSNSVVVSNAATATVVTKSTVFPWGNGDGVATFTVIDTRGRAIVGPDATGGTSANRLQIVGTMTTTASSSVATLVSGGPINLGMIIVNPNVPRGTTVSSVSGSTISMSVAATASATAASTRFSMLTDAQAPGGAGGNSQIGLVTDNLPSYTPTGNITSTVITTHSRNAASSSGSITIATDTTSGTGTISTSSSFAGNFTGDAQGGTGRVFPTVQPVVAAPYIIKVKPNSTGAGGVVSLNGMFGDIVCDATFQCLPVAGINTIGCTTATTLQIGCSKPDGSTITITGGTIHAVGAAQGITVGVTTVSGGTSGNVLRNNGGVLGEYQLSLAGGGSIVLNASGASSVTVDSAFSRTVRTVQTPVTATTLQAAITETVNLGGGVVQIPAGSWSIDTTAGCISIIGPIVLRGSGAGLGTGTGTSLAKTNATTDLFCINNPSFGQVALRDFGATVLIAQNSGTSGINVVGSTGISPVLIENVSLNSFYNGITINNAPQFYINNNLITSFTNNGIEISQPLSADAGVSVVANNKIWDVNGTAGGNAGILWHRGSGLRMHNNRVLGAFNYGIFLDFDNTFGDDGTLLISENMIERQNLYGIYIKREAAAATAGNTIGQLAIIGNHIQALAIGYQNPIAIESSSPSGWVHGATITGNVVQNGNDALLNNAIVRISDGIGITVADNVFYNIGATGGGLYAGANSSSVVFANNNNVGAAASVRYPTTQSTTTITDLTGLPTANLPSAAKNGSQVYASDGNPGCSFAGSGNGALANRVNGSWCGLTTSPVPTTAPAHQYLNVYNVNGTFGSAQPAYSDLSGTIPTGAGFDGYLNGTLIATPSAPTAGHLNIFSSSADGRFHDINAASTVGTTVVAATAASNQFFNTLNANGTFGSAQPAISNLSSINANTVVSNWTGSAATPLANVWPACPSDGAHALTYTNGTGVLCTSNKAVSFTKPTTYDLTTASGTQSLTGFGFRPSTCSVTGAVGGVGLAYNTFFGTSDSAKNQAVTGLFAGVPTYSANFVFASDITGGNFQIGRLSSYDADGITITWTKTNSPTGTFNYAVTCLQ